MFEHGINYAHDEQTAMEVFGEWPFYSGGLLVIILMVIVAGPSSACSALAFCRLIAYWLANAAAQKNVRRGHFDTFWSVAYLQSQPS